MEGSKLHFITLDGDPGYAAKNDAVRKLVKSNASHSWRSKAGVQHNDHAVASLPGPASNHGPIAGKSRFALSSRKPMKRVRRQTVQTNARHNRHISDKEKINGGDDALLIKSKSLSHSHRPLLDPTRAMRCKAQYYLSYLSHATKSKIQTMVQHFFIQFVEDIQHVFGDLAMLMKRDEAIFHATLSIASVFYDTGANEIFHCQQTLNLVSRRLSNHALQASDETIGAVGLLVIHNILNGTSENSILHMNGLQQMVQTRGGLERLPLRLRKTLSMIDFFHATTWDCCPRFPFIRPGQDFSATLKNLPSLFKEDLQTLKRYEESYDKWSMPEMLQVLRILTAVRFSEPLAVFNRLALSEAIYLLEYQLLSSEPTLENIIVNTVGLHKAFRLAVFLYIDKVLREMPPQNIANLVTRLVSALRGFFDTNKDEASIHPQLSILLWILIIGPVNSQNLVDRQYFLEKLVYVCGLLNLKSRIDFQSFLKEVGPVLQPYAEQCEEILGKIGGLRGSQVEVIPV